MVDTHQLELWLNYGKEIASSPQYYNRLTDMNDDNQPDFDNLFFFADDEKPNGIFLRTAITRLKRRAANSERTLKGVLLEFIASSEIIFANQNSIYEVQKHLSDRKIKPDYDTFFNLRTGSADNTNVLYPSKWKQFNHWVGSIGDYFDSMMHTDYDDMTDILKAIFFVICIIILLFVLFSEGFWWALGTFFVLCIIYGIFDAIAKIFTWMIYPPLFLLRLLFYNVYILIGYTTVKTILLFCII